MLSRLIFDDTVPLQRKAVVTRGHATTWSDLREYSQQVFDTYGSMAAHRVGLSFRHKADSYAVLAALDRMKRDAFLFDSQLSVDETLRLGRKLRLGAVLFPEGTEDSPKLRVVELPDEEKWSGDASITILTSGSTGEPKAARHSWQGLSRPVRPNPGKFTPTWLLSYRPNLYAGLQVMLQCFADHGTLAMPDSEMDPAAIAQFMSASGVQLVSATPSYWRRLLMFSDPNELKKIPLIQITLGGEVVDQAILDKLKLYFPKVRLVHIYATTELGRCFSVSDGIAGFPASYLEAPSPDGTEMKVEEGELFVRSPNRMRMYDPYSSQQTVAADWFATGDVVEIKENRVYFVGRKSDMINVAGSKVYPVEVERVIRAIPGVSDVRIFGKTSSIAGELVACEIVAEPGQEQAALRDAINQACRAKLTSPQQPRLIKFVDKINMSLAGKTLRSKSS